MKLSVSIWSVQKKVYKGEMDSLGFISFCHENGVKYVELLSAFLGSEGIRDVKKALETNGMEVSSYSIDNDFIQPEETKREEQVGMMKDGIDIACDLGAKFVRVFSGNEKEGIPFEEARGWIVEGFKSAVPYAEGKGVTLVIENHGLFVGKSDQVRGLIEAVGSKNLRANADVSNFLLANENPLEAVKNLKDYISFVHFKDFKELPEGSEGGYLALDGRRYEGTVIGKGEVPMREIVEVLSENGYDGFLSIEYEGTGDPIEETKESIEFTKSIIV